MPMIKFFSTPNQALLWLQVRRHMPMLALLGITSLVFGYLDGAILINPSLEDKLHRFMSLALNFVVIGSLSYRESESRRTSLLCCWKGVHTPLPVYWPRLVRVDFQFAAISMLLVSLCTLLGLWFAIPFGLPSPSGLFVSVVFCSILATRLMFDALLSILSRHAKIFLAIGLVLAFILSYMYLLTLTTEDEPIRSVGVPGVFFSLLALVAMLLCCRAVLQWTGPRLWRPDSEMPPEVADERRPLFVELPLEQDPFEEPQKAYQWFLARRSALLATQSFAWCFIVLSLVLLLLIRTRVNVPFAVTPCITGAAGLVYTVNLRFFEGLGAVRCLPLSLWSATLNHLRHVSFALALLFAVCSPLYIIELNMIGGTDAARPVDALWQFWSTWTGLSFSPLLLPVGVLVVLRHALGFASLDAGLNGLQSWTMIIGIVALAGLILWRDIQEKAGNAVDRWLVIIPLALIATGLLYLETAVVSPNTLWILREILGASVVVTILRYNAVTHRTPVLVALRIGALVVACVVGVVALLLQFGAPTPPDGVAGLFLGLGVVAPIFLPLLWIPHAIEWARQSGTKHPPEPTGNLQRELWEDLR